MFQAAKKTNMGNNFNNLPNNNHLVRAIHTAVPGRARYKVYGLYRSEAIKKYLEIRLSREKGITQVSANHYTGNVLVFFLPYLQPNAIGSLIKGMILDYYKKQLILSTDTPAIQNGNLHAINSRKTVTTVRSNGENIAVTPILTQTPQPKQLDQLNGQIVLASTAVSGLGMGTGILHVYGLDTTLLLLIQKLQSPFLDRMMLGITSLGDLEYLLLICLGMEANLLYYKRPLEAIIFGTAAVGAIGLNYWMKMLFFRARPALWDWIIDAAHYSFPSGHAMGAMVIYGFIGYILAQQFPQSRRQIIALTVTLIVAIGFSRLYLGVHWPSDVAAGYAAGLLWLIACILLWELKQKYPWSSRYLQQEYEQS
jgi:undecaprenyl-diphosphatase